MRFTPTPLGGAYLIELDPHHDDRGFLARTWCREEFAEHGLNPALVQCNITFTRKKGTLRGMHYQEAPYAEAKLVRCTAGAVFDVIVDLRPASPTFRGWYGMELSAANRRMLYIPEGLAHGLQTLTDDSELFYQMSQVYHPAAARGVRWDDPAFGILWPDDDRTIAPKDQQFPDFPLSP